MEANLHDLICFIKHHFGKFLATFLLLFSLTFLIVDFSIDKRPRFDFSFLIDTGALCISVEYFCDVSSAIFLNEFIYELASDSALAGLSGNANYTLPINNSTEYGPNDQNLLGAVASINLPFDLRFSGALREGDYQLTVSGVAPTIPLVGVVRQAIFSTAVEVASKIQRSRAEELLAYVRLLDSTYIRENSVTQRNQFDYVRNQALLGDISAFIENNTFQGNVVRPITFLENETKLITSRFNKLNVKALVSVCIAFCINVLGFIFLLLRSGEIYSFDPILREKRFRILGTLPVSQPASARSLVVRNVILELLERSEAQVIRILVTGQLSAKTSKMIVATLNALLSKFNLIVSEEYNTYGQLVVVLSRQFSGVITRDEKNAHVKIIEINAVCFGKTKLTEFLSVISLKGEDDDLLPFLLGIELPRHTFNFTIK